LIFSYVLKPTVDAAVLGMGFLGQPVETLLRVNMPNLSRREQVKK
jgi:hypothetical protein